MNRFQKINSAFKASLFGDPGPIAIDGKPENDLRYGSELVKRDWAYPSWYGLHSNFGPVITSTPDGRTVSYTQLYATQPWVYATVMRYLTFMQLVPPKVYRVGDDGSKTRLRPKDHPLAKAIAHPWRKGNANDLMASILMPMLVHGNAAIEVDSGAGDALRFIPRDWRNLAPQQIAAHYVSGWSFEDEAFDEVKTITAERMLHVAWASPCGVIGVSPLSALGVTLSSEIAAQLYGLHNFQNMATPSMVVQTDAEFFGGLEQEERDAILADFREQIAARYSGPTNAGIPALMPPGLEVKPFSHTAQEAVLIEQRKLNREEVEGVYLMPPPLVGQLDHATYSNIETQKQMGYADTLGPQAVKIAQAITTQVAQDLLGEDDVFVEIDLNGVLRGSQAERMAQYERGFNIGIYTRNEIRAMENLDRIMDDPTADMYFVQANNMRPASQLDDTNEAESSNS